MTNNAGYSYKQRSKILNQTSDQKWINKSKLFSFINSIGQYIITALVQGQQPRVWQSCDRLGQTWWYGYDPVTGRSICRGSEDEIRVWLEERYYR